MNHRFVVGNWKMNHGKEDISKFANAFAGNKLIGSENVHAWIAPQSLNIVHAMGELTPLGIKVGAQNCHHESSGAFTGEISAKNIYELGCEFVIVGHSERRQFFRETNLEISKKAVAAFESNLHVIYCCGETLEEREAGRTLEVIADQMKGFLTEDVISHGQHLLIAYEPVWAIGTGKTATPEQASEVHQFIKKTLGSTHKSLEDLPVLYGGSVKPSNFKDLLSREGIDGGLVGGASLKPDSFKELFDIACS